MPTPPPSADGPPEYFEQPTAAPAPRKRLSRRASILGSVIALLVVVGVGWLAWSLTRPAEPTAAAQRGPGGGGGGGGGAGRPGGGPGGRGGATTVGFAVAERADIPVTLEALGTVVPQATVRVRPQVSGVLEQVLFKEGQNVKRGQLLATIDPRPFEMALQQALGARMRDEAQLAAARVTLARFETLLKQDSIARQEVDTQTATVRQLEAAVVTSKANEGTARLNLGYTRIVAPIDGRVGLRTVDVGNTVGPSDANGVGVITKLSPIDVEFAVPQDHASWLQHNAGAFMEVKATDRTRTTLLDTGAFASLDNQIDTQTGTVRAKARFNNTRQQLFPSQFVNVQLQLRTINDAVVVPVSALRQGGSGDYVFVLMDDRTVKLRPVVRGQPVGDKVQVANGLAIGEKVITEGADRLRDGARVMLPGDTPGGGGGPGGQGRRRQGAASAAQPAASEPFQGASAARRNADVTSPWAGAREAPLPASPQRGEGQAQRPNGAASSAMGAGANLTPEERAARRQRRQEAASAPR
ncbi:efflux RND transporter periplasmic adaptor subunit [Caenimonas sedimenti]|uniref:Efflux RND transporter periplasmic adaptor subunit n=1 Tax=Caenimonas sedimenti TaxID=2596921 RepID=A0A562ZT30_9BURK|nr:efflux RND transporter periplasmic adaptor subunit [Caenimonas sedimenti]TWO71567.1 efflux RND transporter periplasmic adaptor subunit [Caenimonas sedimenti]